MRVPDRTMFTTACDGGGQVVPWHVPDYAAIIDGLEPVACAGCAMRHGLDFADDDSDGDICDFCDEEI